MEKTEETESDEALQDIPSLEPKAVAAASLLMGIIVAKGANRQCVAASVSALFNLLVQHSPSHATKDSDSEIPQNMIAATGQLAKDLIAQFFCDDDINALADAIKLAKRVLPSSLCRKLQEFNSAGSYGRHHGASGNNKSLRELSSALASLEHGSVQMSDLASGDLLENKAEKEDGNTKVKRDVGMEQHVEHMPVVSSAGVDETGTCNVEDGGDQVLVQLAQTLTMGGRSATMTESGCSTLCCALR